ncbi:MAG: phosphatidate cytidylyltransferase [Bacteroidia bacterium]|nr:phosphatidate cytidylyltransferase [Bacteroidia bacterium]
MNADIMAYLILSVSFLFIFAIGDFLYYYVKIAPEYSRKTVHILSGLLACLFPVYFSNYWWVLAICISFFVLLKLSMRFNFLKGINGVDRKTYGSMVYPLGVFLSFFFYSLNINRFVTPPYFLFYIPLLILTLSDPAAAIIGKRFPLKKFTQKPGSKSCGGSSAFFVTALLISYFILPVELRKMGLVISLAIITTLSEAFSMLGLDNLFIPLSAVLLLYIYIL